MSDIKIVGWPKRPAEVRRDELEIENAELRKSLSDRESELDITMAEQEQLIDEIAKLRKLVEQMRERVLELETENKMLQLKLAAKYAGEVDDN